MTDLVDGVVVRIEPRRIWVAAAGERILTHVPRGMKSGPRLSAHIVAVGDRVRLRPSPGQEAVLEEIYPRRNLVARVDPGSPRIQLAVAANLDYVVVVVSAALPRFQPRALDRLLLVGECSGVPCLIVWNKTDLVPVGAADACLEPYRSLGYPVFPTSAKTGEGCAALVFALSGRESLLLGPSGVGKSALLNRLVPGLTLTTRPVSRSTAKGVHTTTVTEWVGLPSGGAVLDAPGIRSIQPWGLDRWSLAAAFREFRNLPACQFGDCLHDHEPGCSVRRAVEEGTIHASRHESYLRVLASL